MNAILTAALLLACAQQTTKPAPETSTEPTSETTGETTPSTETTTETTGTTTETTGTTTETTGTTTETTDETTEEVPETPAELVDGALVLETTEGPLVVTPVYHGTASIEAGGVTYWVDPWSQADLDDAPKADVVLITDIHSDHLDEAAIGRIFREGALIVAPAAVAEEIEGYTVDHILANDESIEIGDFSVRAEPMYNLERGPDEHTLYHDKGRGNGYVLTFGGRTVYFAGDTECTPEMAALEGIDLAFIPMNLPFTMTPEEAAGCVNDFAPGVVVPYHYGSSDLAEFEAAVTNEAVIVTLVEFYPEE